MSDHAVILGPDGVPMERPATFLPPEDAETLRQYQAFGAREGLQGSMKCRHCGGDVEVYVQGDIGLFCSCRTLLWKAS